MSLPGPDEARDRIERSFAWLDPSGAMAAECFAGYAVKLRAFAAADDDPLADLRANWQQHEAAIDTLLAAPADIRATLATAGLPVGFGQLAQPVSAATTRWAAASCALQRQRVGVADLAMLLGAWHDDDIDKVLAESGALDGTS